MQTQLPEPIKSAIEGGREFFWGEDGAEWKLHIESESSLIEKLRGSPVLIFANNGYGDYLFIEKHQIATHDITVFVYFHETQEVAAWKDSLQMLLGLVPRKPSTDAYPKAVYESGETVELGDKVLFKAWLFFWKGWMDGTVQFVPGVSPRNPEHEHDGLKWVSIKGREMIIGSLVEPESGVIKRIKFVRRGEQ